MHFVGFSFVAGGGASPAPEHASASPARAAASRGSRFGAALLDASALALRMVGTIPAVRAELRRRHVLASVRRTSPEWLPYTERGRVEAFARVLGVDLVEGDAP